MIGAAGALFAAFALFAILLGLRMAMGPAPAQFLTSWTEKALGTVTGKNLAPRIGRTVLTWDRGEHALKLDFLDLDLNDPKGRRVAHFPRVQVVFGAETLLAGRLAPRDVFISNATVQLVRRPSGSVELGFGAEPAATASPAEAPTSPIDAVAAVQRATFDADGVLSHLRRLRLERSVLVFDDAVTNRRWTGDDLQFTFDRLAQRPVATLTGSLTNAGTRMSVDMTAQMDPVDRSASVEAGFSGYVPALFDVGNRFLGPFGGIAAPLSGHIGARLGPDGRLSSARVAATAGEGAIEYPAFFPEGLRLGGGDLSLRIDFAARTATIERLALKLGDAPFLGQGDLSFGPAGLGFDGLLTLDRMDVAALASLWPVAASPDGRRWAVHNVRGGTISAARIVLHGTPGVLDRPQPPADLVTGTFHVDDTTVNYLDGLTPLDKVDADFAFDADSLSTTVARGQVDLKSGGLVTLTGGTARISDFDKPDQIADIAFGTTSGLPAALRLLDQPPLGYGRKIGIDPANVDGKATVDAKFHFPLRARLELADMTFSTRVRLADAAIRNGPFHLDLSGGAFLLDVDQAGLKGSGSGQLAGAPVEAMWSHSFVPVPGKPPLVIDLKTMVGESLLQRFGVEPHGRLTGAFPLTLAAEGRLTGISRIGLDADLTPAGLTLPEVGWSKPAGQAGHAALDILPQPDGGYRFADVVATAPALDVRGEGAIDGQGRLTGASTGRVKIGNNALTATLAPGQGGGPMRLAVDADVIDLRPYIALPPPKRQPESQRPSPAERDGLPDFDMTAHIGRIDLDAGVSVTQIEAATSHSDGLWRSAKAKATVAPAGHAELSLDSTPTARRFSLTSTGGAGAIVRAFDLYDGAAGGTLAMTGTIDDTLPNRPLKAHLAMRDFKIVGAPILARILTLGSLTGIAEALGASGISFKALEADITQDDLIMRMHDGRAFGDSIGATFEGTYDSWARSISVGGEIVPSYSFNHFIGSIPLLGTLLTGGEGGGILAFTYSVTGAIEKPDVSVNPLSVLAPGILRDIVGAIDGSRAAADAKAPPPVAP